MHSIKIPSPNLDLMDDFDAYIAQMEKDFGPVPTMGSGASSSYMPSAEMRSLDGFPQLPLMPPIPETCYPTTTAPALVSPTSSITMGRSPRSGQSVRRSGCNPNNVREQVREFESTLAFTKERNRAAQAKFREKHRTEFATLKAERESLMERARVAEETCAHANTELLSCREAIDMQRDMICRLTADVQNLNILDRVDMGVINALEQCAFDMRITRDIAQAQRTANDHQPQEPPCEQPIPLP